MAGGAREAGRTVVGRALSLLATFDSEHPRQHLSQIAQRSGVPLSTTHRLLAELEQWDALCRAEDGSYEVGRRVWELGLLAPLQLELREVARPFMQDVYSAIGDNVHLAVRDGTEALYVERISGKRSVRIVSAAGTRLPLHATGVGKVLLAAAPPDVVDAVLHRLTRVTRHTVIEPGRLLRELAAVRDRGYARTAEEMTLGTCSVAVPVRGAESSVVAALGIVVTSVRRDVSRLVPVLQVAAAGISRRLELTSGMPAGSLGP